MLRVVLVWWLLATCVAVVCVTCATTGPYPGAEELEYVATPAGRMHRNCVREVPSGARVKRRDTEFLVTLEDGSSYVLPKCDTGGKPMLLPRETDTDRRVLLRGATEGEDPLRAYDGWTTYAAFHNPGGDIRSFLGFFSAPDHPVRRPEVLYIFTGLQNIDWIPVVDPEPSQPFDIIQPVLQYPGNAFNDKWGVRSWYVTLDAGALYSALLTFDQNDMIFGNMTRTGQTSWDIISVVQSSKKATTLHADDARLRVQPWAYVTLECYGCAGCDTYPKNPSKFTAMTMTNAQGAPLTASWISNPKPTRYKQCQESVTIHSSAAVDINFRTSDD